MKVKLFILFVIILSLFAASNSYGVNVAFYPTVQDAYNATPHGGTLYFPMGNYTLETRLEIDKPVNIIGEGYNTVIITSCADGIFRFNRNKHVSWFSSVSVENIRLVSLKTTGTLIEWNRVSNSFFEDVWFRGGKYGIHLNGCLRDELHRVWHDAGYYSNGAPLTDTGIYTINDTVSNNANRFINVNPRSCRVGILAVETNSQGGMSLSNSTIEGCREYSIIVRGMTVPIVIRDVHFESNGNDVLIENCSVVDISGGYAGRITLKDVLGAKVISMRLGEINSIASGTEIDNLLINKQPEGVYKKIGTVNFANGTSVSPVIPTGLSNQVPGDIEVWEKSLPVGFTNYYPQGGTIVKSNDSLFNDTSALLTSRGGHTFLAYKISGKAYQIIKDGELILSFWAKSTSTTLSPADICLRFRGGVDSYVTAQERVSNQWTKISRRFKMNSLASEVTCLWGMYGKPSGSSVIIDGIELISDVYDSGRDK